MQANNIIWHPTAVRKDDRQRLNGHRSAVLWFTGLSGSGKSTLADALEKRFYDCGIHTYLLDGDNIRHGLNRDLGFSAAERTENIRRVAEVARLLADAGCIVLTAFISPYRADRALARERMESGEFLEIYVRCSLEECERRDPKGLYAKARRGEIPSFTGVSDPYEEPQAPELEIDTGNVSVEEAVEEILEELNRRGILRID